MKVNVYLTEAEIEAVKQVAVEKLGDESAVATHLLNLTDAKIKVGFNAVYADEVKISIDVSTVPDAP